MFFFLACLLLRVRDAFIDISGFGGIIISNNLQLWILWHSFSLWSVNLCFCLQLFSFASAADVILDRRNWLQDTCYIYLLSLTIINPNMLFDYILFERSNNTNIDNRYRAASHVLRPVCSVCT